MAAAPGGALRRRRASAAVNFRPICHSLPDEQAAGSLPP